MRHVGRVVAACLGAGFASLAYAYLTLPDVRPLRDQNPTATAFMELRTREAIAAGQEPQRRQTWAPYNHISPTLRRAVLIAEDAAFWQHRGVDLQQVRESIEANLERWEFVRGASTITQQLAKNLYLSPSKSPLRKFRELLITGRLEAELGKRRILELYLNVIEWGDGIYGAEAAARAYFGKAAAVLGAEEAALLAGAIINPRALNPAQPPRRLRRRQQIILRRMGDVTTTPAPQSTPGTRDPTSPDRGLPSPQPSRTDREDSSFPPVPPSGPES